MKSQAVLLRQTGAPLPYEGTGALQLVEIDLAPPRSGEVLVRIEAAGVCHSDLSVLNGSRPRPLPLILGHESAGVVEEVGVGVKGLKAGDHVASIFLPCCGDCPACNSGVPAHCSVAAAANVRGDLIGGGSRISFNGEEIRHHNGVSCYSQYMILDQRSLVKIPDDLPLDLAALFGCAMLTGFGAVKNSARAREGESLGIWGLGGVGFSALIGAVVAKASPIIAIDPMPDKRTLALALGADFAIHPDENVRDYIPAGVMVAVEAVGKASALKAAYESTARGGTTVTVGLPPASEQLTFSAVSLVTDVRTIKGSYLGSADPRKDIPEYLSLWREGKLPIDKLLTATRPMSEVSKAMDLLHSATVIRQVLHPHSHLSDKS